MRTSHFFTAVLAFANFAQATQLQTPMMAQLEANTDLDDGFLGFSQIKDKELECTEDKTPEEKEVEYFKALRDHTIFDSKTSDKHKKVKTAILELYKVLNTTTPFDKTKKATEEEKAYGIEDPEPNNGYFELDYKKSCLSTKGLKSAGRKYSNEIVKAIEKL